MKLEADELAKQILLGDVNCEFCQNHLRCEVEENLWYCTMSEKTPTGVCEQWEPPRLSDLNWNFGYDRDKNYRALLKVHRIKENLDEFNARRLSS